MERIELLRPGPASIHSNMQGAVSRRSRMLDNPMADGLFCDVRPSQMILGIGPLCVLPLVAYPQANSRMGSSIEYSAKPFRYHLDTSAFKGERGIAIAFKAFDMRIDEDWTIFQPVSPKAIPAFPQESCWAGMDRETGVPTLSDLSERRFAMRTDAARIGLIVRYYGHEGSSRHDIFMHHRPSFVTRALVSSDPAPAKVIPLHQLAASGADK